MKYAASALPRRGSRTLIPAFVTLALWRLRQTWRLLLVTGVGILAAVVIVCAVPLFSQVALNAGLRDVLTATPEDSQLLLQIAPNQWSTTDLVSIRTLLSEIMQSQLGGYLGHDSQLTLQTAGLTLDTGDAIQLSGVTVPQAQPHLRVLQGRLPATSGASIEIAITPDTAQALHVTVGSTLPIMQQLSIRGGMLQFGQEIPLAATLPLHVVGIIAPPSADPFWHGNDFQPEVGGSPAIYKALMSTNAYTAALSQVASQHGGSWVSLQVPPQLLWYFSLDVAHITMDNLDDLIVHLNAAPQQLVEQFTSGVDPNDPLPQLSAPTISQDSAPSSLERFRDRAGLVQIPMVILTFQIVALLLFFISMTAGLLIERQSEVLALLRSRGARRRQVFGAFAIQGLGLGLVAFLAGPLLAVFLVQVLSHLSLPPSEQSVLSITLGDPLQTSLRIGWFAGAAVAAAVLAVLLAVAGTARRDVLALRREAARSTRRPLWQRLYLDLVAAVIALTGSGISLYLAHSGTLDARTAQLLATPLDLIGPFFLLLAGTLFFLRLFPLLLALLAQGVRRRPGAPLLLALAQMARSPQSALRLILLLALAVAFAGFTLVFTASEQQHIGAVATQQVGADFSGILLSPTTPAARQATLSQWERPYQRTPGVLAASAGYVMRTSLSDGTLPLAIQVLAVNPRTFAQVALWTAQDASKPLSAVLAELAKPAVSVVGVPAVVDAVTWNQLQLAPGIVFTLSSPDLPFDIPYTAIAEVQHLPSINDSLATSGTGDYSTPGGILVDYHDLNVYYQRMVQSKQPLAPNHLWLRTSDNPTSLAHVRAALTSGSLSLLAFQDRRALLEQMQRDPLYRALTTVLWLGTVTTLLLALAGTLLASWLHARARLTSFALLRALGSAPRQIASVLAWEQGIVYTVAILLGGLFGALLVLTAVPGLVFANPDSAANPISSGEFYVIQQVLPVQIILPATLGLAGAALVLICAAALVMMARVVSKPSISQTLRLNED